MMNAFDRAVVKAATRWAAKPTSAKRARALQEAVERRNRNTCPATAIWGDPTWPYILKCERVATHEGAHADPVRGDWTAGR